MPEECVPSGTGNKYNYLEVSAVLNSFLSDESLDDVIYPAHLVGDYVEFETDKRKEWLGYTYQTLLGACFIYVSEILERTLEPKEAGFIAGRVETVIHSHLLGRNII